MIKRTFDFGWGAEFELKKFEKQILDEYLRPLKDQEVVLINSTWYSDRHHKETVEELAQMDFDAIVLVSFIDCAIPHASWFKQFERPVYEVGYYDSNYRIDFWALAVDRYFNLPTFGNVRHTPNTAFMCLNRKPHWHRKRLIADLQRADLIEDNLVSYGSENSREPVIRLNTDVSNISAQHELAPNAGEDQNGIINDIMSLGSEQNWNAHFLNVVTETVYDINQNHFVTEKTWKPVVGYRPFFIYDPDLGTKWLTDRGFETYNTDFTDLIEEVNTPTDLMKLLILLSQQERSYYNKKIVDLKEKILYNRKCFTSYVERQKLKIKEGIICQI